MPVAPTPPAKPSLPPAPTLTPASSNTAANPSASATTNSTPKSSQAVSPVVPATVKELEGLGKAFQGNSVQAKIGEKAEPATPIKKTNNMAAPASNFNSQAAVSTQTTVPANPAAVDSKPAGLNYIPFVVIVGIVAVILVGLHLVRNKKEQKRTILDYSKRTTAVIDNDGLDIVVASETTAPKVKRNFELRV